MARETIARTIYETICEVEFVDKNNNTKTGTLTLYGNYDVYGALNPARRKMGTKRLIVKSVSHRSYYAKMSFEKFANLSEKENVKEW